MTGGLDRTSSMRLSLPTTLVVLASQGPVGVDSYNRGTIGQKKLGIPEPYNKGKIGDSNPNWGQPYSSGGFWHPGDSTTLEVNPLLCIQSLRVVKKQMDTRTGTKI